MSKVDDFIESQLEHAYASKYYDPQKAHEYYERTKKLKGRRSSSQLKSKRKKDTWSVAKSNINAAKKAELTKSSTDRKSQVQQLRTGASGKREVLREKLKDVMSRLSDSTQRKIDAVPPIPKGLNKEERARRSAERQEEIAKIRGERDKNKQSEREGIATKREQVSTELKTSIETARKNYEAKREQIKAKYEAEADREFEAIRRFG